MANGTLLIKDDMNEIWKQIPGYENYYEVSNLGRVRSLERLVTPSGRKSVKKGKILSPRPDKNGYLITCLCIDGVESTKKVHRLVALAFIGSSDLQVNHIDCCKINNHISNLEYVTNQENRDHAVANGRMHGKTNPNRSNNNPNNVAKYNTKKAKKLTPELVKQIKVLRETGFTYASIGKQFGISANTTRKVCLGITWK